MRSVKAVIMKSLEVFISIKLPSKNCPEGIVLWHNRQICNARIPKGIGYVPAARCQIQLPVKYLGKATENGPNAWVQV